MNASQPSTYDQLPYTRYPFPNTHPDRLASIARVFGLTPPDVRSCRVLEIGCGRGGNLIPLAEQLPGSRLVGIDLSRIQIEEAQAWVSQLGFTNVTFLQMDIVDVEPSLGMFDYIVCHGVFSWVPDRVQQAILRICSEQLAPHGIAYISYNTKPGWNYRGSLRDAMLFHARPFQQPEEKLAEAKKLIDLLAKNLTGEEPHQKLLLNEIKSLEGKEDSYLVHEYLEETNSPCYFHEFANQLQSNGLQYVSEADLSLPFAKPETHSLSDAFESLSTSYLQLEQYSDFLSGRMFRQSLVCHEMQKVNRNCDPKVLLHFRLESLLEPCDPLPDPNPKPDSNPSENQVDLKHLYRSSYRSSYRYKHTGKVVQLDLERPLVECALRILAEVGNRGCSLAWLFAKPSVMLQASALYPQMIIQNEILMGQNGISMRSLRCCKSA